MVWKYPVLGVILLTSVVCMAGCTGPAPAPVVTPAPVQVAATVPVTPVPAGTTAPLTPKYSWTTETPYAGRPYTKTYTFEGTGDFDEHTFTTDNDRTWVFRMTCPREGEFLVLLQDNKRNTVEVLADTGGIPAAREKSVWLKAGTYWFDVKADAPWTITMSTG